MWAPWNHKCSCKGEAEGSEVRERSVKMKVEVRAMQPGDKDCEQPLEAGRGKKMDSPPEGTHLSQHLD